MALTVKELMESGAFEVLAEGEETQREIGSVFCCDLLSVAMGRAPAGCSWVTVMANVNTLAVASLAEAACVILAEGTAAEPVMVKKAQTEGITLLRTEQPVFETALAVHRRLEAEG